MINNDTNILDIIIALTKAIKQTPKTNKDQDCFFTVCQGIKFNNIKYILNQLLRQYDLPKDHIFVSEEAKNLWDEISTPGEDIFNYSYKQKFVLYKLPRKNLDIYKGNSSKPDKENKKLKAGDKIEFRQIFHEEHVIPIKNIIEKLIALDDKDLTYDNVKEILNSIFICIILKSENANLSHKRDCGVIDVVENIYNPKVKIYNWEEIKKLYNK